MSAAASGAQPSVMVTLDEIDKLSNRELRNVLAYFAGRDPQMVLDVIALSAAIDDAGAES